MSRTALDLWVGLFVAIGFAALVFLAMKVGNFSGLSGAETYRVEAPFDNIGGLKVRAPVKSSGVLVGRVAASASIPRSTAAVVVHRDRKRYRFRRHHHVHPHLRPARRAIYRTGGRAATKDAQGWRPRADHAVRGGAGKN